MKKSILILLSLFLFQSVQCQEIDSLTLQSNQEKYDFHYTKHRKLRKTGFILLGVGVASMGAGALVGSNTDGFWDDSDNNTTGALLFTAGALSTISSIPVFIVSGSQKRKAEAYVQVRGYQLIDSDIPSSKYVSLGVRLNF